jgi:hypothetical protein
VLSYAKKCISLKYPKAVSLYRRIKGFRQAKLSRQSVFESIYKNNSWGDAESASGPGSNLHQTDSLRSSLESLIKNLEIGSLADIPCGDFKWMQLVDMGQCKYIGGDIVPELIEQNRKLFESDARTFIEVDLVDGTLPIADAILVRDCLVHLTNADCLRAIHNIKSTGFRYLLATTFTNVVVNTDIVTGQHRAQNLSIYPYELGEPLTVIDEKSPSSYAKEFGKSLGVWRL